MSIIKLPLLYVGTKGEKTLYTLFDSGANISCISPELVESLGVGVELGRERKLATASENHFITVTQRILLDFYIDDILLSDEFLLVPGLSEEVILGAATLQKWKIRLDFEHDTVQVNPEVGRMRV